MKNNHNPSTHVNSLSKAVLEQLATIGSEGDAKTQIVDESGNVIGATSNALDVNVKSDAVGIALDATLTDGSQETKIVDGSGNVIGATSNALDVNIKSGATLEVKLDNENDDVLIYGFDGAANQKIKTHTDGAIQIKAIADSVAVTTDVETGLAKDTTLTGGSQKVKIVDASGNLIYPAGEPVTQSVEITRPADTTAYTANDAINSSTSEPVAFEFTGMAVAAGGGGMLAQVKVETDIAAMAAQQLRLWFFNATPANIANDNAAFVHYYADKAKRLFYIDVNMNALLAGSDVIVGVTLPLFESYNCAATSLFVLVQALTGFTPTSAGKLYVTLTANRMA